MITDKGRELALKLVPASTAAATYPAQDLCSRICRTAATLHRLAEEDCNGHPMQSTATASSDWAMIDRLQAAWEERVDRDQQRYRQRLAEQVSELGELLEVRGLGVERPGTCLWCGRRLPRFLGDPDRRGYMGAGYFDTATCGWQFGVRLAELERRLQLASDPPEEGRGR